MFGGMGKKGEKRLVTMVNGNRLEQKGTLDFDFVAGGCTVLNQTTIVLSFSWYESKLCHRSENPVGSFTKIPNSFYHHRWIRIASFDGKKLYNFL